MNRSIPLFVLIFAVAFGGAYLLTHGGSRPAAGPSAAAKPAAADGLVTRQDGGQTPTPTWAGDPGDIEAPGAPSGEPLQAEQGPDKPVASPKHAARQAGKANKPNRVVVKRPAATPAPPEADGGSRDPDLDRLQGTWQIVDTEYDGERLPEEGRDYSWEFGADKYTIKYRDKFQELWAVRLDSGRDPKTINSVNDPTGARLLGIYELTGDTLRVCYDLTRNGRPDTFTAPKGSRRACFYFQRSP
jgi:uncharacterized protein (TIGR03067 family)